MARNTLARLDALERAAALARRARPRPATAHEDYLAATRDILAGRYPAAVPDLAPYGDAIRDLAAGLLGGVAHA